MEWFRFLRNGFSFKLYEVSANSMTFTTIAIKMASIQ